MANSVVSLVYTNFLESQCLLRGNFLFFLSRCDRDMSGL